MVYLQEQTLGDAVAEFKKAATLEGGNPLYIAHLGIAYAAVGRRSEAVKILGDLQELARRNYVSPLWKGLILAYMGKRRMRSLKRLKGAMRIVMHL